MLNIDKIILNNLNFKLKNIINSVVELKINSIIGFNNTLKAIFTALLTRFSTKNIIYICPDNKSAMKAYNNICDVTDCNIELFLPQEYSVYDFLYTDEKFLSDFYTVFRKINSSKGNIIVTAAKNIMHKFPCEDFCNHYKLEFTIGFDYELKDIVQKLVNLGYQRESVVTKRGSFCLKGDILDVFPINSEPLRIEFWDTQIDNIRVFDTNTQMSIKRVKYADIYPRYTVVNDENFKKNLKSFITNKKGFLSEEVLDEINSGGYFSGIEYFQFLNSYSSCSFLDIFKKDTIFVFDEFSEVSNNINSSDKKYLDEYNSKLANNLIYPLEKLNHFTFEEINLNINKVHHLSLNSFVESINDFTHIVDIKNVKKFSLLNEGISDYFKKLKSCYKTIIVSTKYPQRTKDILDYQDDFYLIDSSLNEGFLADDYSIALISDYEIYGKINKDSTFAKKGKFKQTQMAIESVDELKVGDIVVHAIHGVGKFIEFKQLEINDEYKDYLVIEYANADKLYIPAEQVNLLSAYKGSCGMLPKLSKMGGKDWDKTTSKVKKSVDKIAKDLVELYANRAKQKGFKFEEDSPWQNELEDSFPYSETPDQLNAIIDTKNEMQSEYIMDRLICGDVGFGKTEVALRAVFKAVLSGKQVAILVPTTILAQQHFETFKDRFAPYPVDVDLLSRFRSKKEQTQTLKKLATVECDVVIGTHRLLQKDVSFKNLGLIVVDEEHRFGVKNKEKLKQIKASVDVLTLSATPIPRTLHMAMSGIREISLISTPPINRAPIKTFVGEMNMSLIKSAINFEIQREGQGYILYNKVQSINKFAAEIQDLVPNARLAIAHGQMGEKELENVMTEFSEHKYDFLICTTIIESGLDIQNANTMIVVDCDKFGLAQLYQIRGRVGRSDRQAYSYFLYKKGKKLSCEAKDRLKAIKEFTTLGSGYYIAQRDMEIRGIGNLLGPQQHGNMIQIGYDAYCSILDEAIKQAKGEPVKKKEFITIDLNITAFIPDYWINDKSQKMIEYKRLANVETQKELDLIELEWKDRFGKIPHEVQNIISIIHLRLLASDTGIIELKQAFDKIRIFTSYSKNEWLYLVNEMPNHIKKCIIWEKATKESFKYKSIINVKTSNLNEKEIFNILEDLFYYISRAKNEFLTT